MPLYYGIYGYLFTQPFTYLDVEFIPRYTDYEKAKSYARSTDSFELTGCFKSPGDPFDYGHLKDIETVLSFIEHQQVLVRGGYSFDDDVTAYKTLSELYTDVERPIAGGTLILEDRFYATARTDFFTRALDYLSASTAKAGAFRQCIYKRVLCYTMSPRYVDVEYYLLFSGLEAIARQDREIFDGGAARPIADYLIGHGFNVALDDVADDLRSITNYCHVRNALFHNGHYEKNVNVNGKPKSLRLTTYLEPLSILVPLALMKHVGFHHDHINWNSWRDRQPFLSTQ